MTVNYFILGCGGFLGSHLLDYVSTRPGSRAFGTTSNKNSVRLKKSAFQDCIYSEEQILRMAQEAIFPQGRNVLIDCRWWGVSNNYKNDHDQLKVNMEIIRFALELGELIEPEKYIFFGSQAEYGLKSGTIHEHSTLEPITEYGRAKVEIYHYLERYFEDREQSSWNWVRIFSLYGPDDNLGWLPQLLMSALQRHQAIATTFGEQVWNYLHVFDACRYIERLSNSTYSGVVNLAHERSIRLADFMLRGLKQAGLGRIVMGKREYGTSEVMNLLVDTSLLKALTRTSPEINPEEGFRTILDQKHG